MIISCNTIVDRRPRTISDSFKELFRLLYIFFNLTEYKIKESVLWSDTNVKLNMISKKDIRFCLIYTDKIFCLFTVTLGSPYHLAGVSGAHFTQGTIVIVILVASGSAKRRTHQMARSKLQINNKANLTYLYPPTKGYLRDTCKSQNITPIYLTLSSPTVSFRS